MSITLYDKHGKVVLHRVAKTVRGFNKKQRQEITKARLRLRAGE